MFRKLTFIALGAFGFSSLAGQESPISSERNLLSDTAPVTAEAIGGGEAEGFWGAVELKYVTGKNGGDRGHDFSYRARAGWKGEVNDVVKWGVSLSSNVQQDGTQQSFSNYAVKSLHLEQAYVAYKPAEGFSIKAGKFGWHTDFQKTGVFYDDDLYAEGVFAKYHQSVGEASKIFAKLGVVKQTDVEGGVEWSGPFDNNELVKAMVGGSFHGGGVHTKVHVGVANDTLFKGSDDKPTTLGHIGLKVAAHNMAVPVGAFGLYSTNSKNVFKFKDHDAYTAGVFVGKAGSVKGAEEANDYSVAVSYYDYNDGTAWNTAVSDTDYAAEGKGLAVRAQYNVLDSTNLVVKYAHGTGDSKGNKAVGELTFKF